jgi:hypothetical protein
MKQKKNYYLEKNLDRLLDAAERRVEALKIQKEIRTINARLELLGHSPQRADDAQPSAVHDAPLP